MALGNFGQAFARRVKGWLTYNHTWVNTLKVIKMMLTTTENINKKYEILGIVRGNTIRARWFGRDIAAGLKMIVGGEIKSYTDMISKSRDQAVNRMIEDAKKLGADAIVNVRFSTSDIMQGAAEVMAYGTAVKFRK